MKELVARWDAAVCAYERAGPSPPRIVEEPGSVLRAPAGEARIAALEARLGVALPPSYRGFLAVSDGAFAQPAAGVIRGPDPLGFLDCERVAWLRDDDRVSIDIWVYEHLGSPFQGSVPEVRYLDHDGGGVSSDSVKTGHLLYALRISGWDDSGVWLLNPLVVDQHGEWEVWHFSPKYLGAFRFRSFAALLEHDIDQLRGAPARQAERRGDVDGLQAVVLDRSRPDDERVRAAGRLLAARQDDVAVPALLELAAPAGPLELRINALRCLAASRDPRALRALTALADESDAHQRLLIPVIGRLASSHDHDAADAAVRLLTGPHASTLLHHVGRGSADVLWRVWQATAHPEVIVQLAYCADPRACAPLTDLIVDPAIDSESRERLAWYAHWPRDPSVIPALVEAAQRDLAPLVSLATALAALGAHDEAIAVLVRAAREHPRDGRPAQQLGWSRHPAAAHALLELFREHPTPTRARALGWSPAPEAIDALHDATNDPALRAPAIDALEKIGSRDARERLAALADAGDIQALRALARRRDARAREHLLALLDDPDRAREGADGLRDLRDPTTAPALLAHVGTDQSDLTITAAHALVCMQAPEATIAIRRLLGSEHQDTRRLAATWRTTRAAT